MSIAQEEHEINEILHVNKKRLETVNGKISLLTNEK